MNWIIRFFGLKGSWKWACKQMERGEWVRPAHATGSVKYRIDNETQGRIVWTFKREPIGNKDWGNANIFLSDFDATDWVCV